MNWLRCLYDEERALDRAIRSTSRQILDCIAEQQLQRAQEDALHKRLAELYLQREEVRMEKA